MVENEASLPRCLGLGMKPSIVSHIASGSEREKFNRSRDEAVRVRTLVLFQDQVKLL